MVKFTKYFPHFEKKSNSYALWPMYVKITCDCLSMQLGQNLCLNYVRITEMTLQVIRRK